MSFHHGIGNGSAPFHNANRENGQTSVTGNIAQTICKIALTLTTQPRDPVGWDAAQHIDGELKTLQKFQPIQQSVNICCVLANLKLA